MYPLVDERKIIKFPARLQLCLFAAILNAADNIAERTALTGGIDPYAKNSYELFRNFCYERVPSRKDEHGYSSDDIACWLIHLRNRGLITAYRWVRASPVKTRPTNLINGSEDFSNSTGLSTYYVLVFGRPRQLTGTMKRSYAAMLEDGIDSSSQEKLKKKKVLQQQETNFVLENWSKAGRSFAQEGGHAISISHSRITNRRVLFDDQNKIGKLATVYSLTNSLACIETCFHFGVQLP